jgi:hypothetical protein
LGLKVKLGSGDKLIRQRIYREVSQVSIRGSSKQTEDRSSSISVGTGYSRAVLKAFKHKRHYKWSDSSLSTEFDACIDFALIHRDEVSDGNALAWENRTRNWQIITKGRRCLKISDAITNASFIIKKPKVIWIFVGQESYLVTNVNGWHVSHVFESQSDTHIASFVGEIAPERSDNARFDREPWPFTDLQLSLHDVDLITSAICLALNLGEGTQVRKANITATRTEPISKVFLVRLHILPRGVSLVWDL